MKLYSEEQVIKAIESAFLNVAGYPSILSLEEILEELTPIELPSDEEIREERLLQFPDSEYANRANDRLAFYCGAKFVINKIQGGNK
jgi:hypothetical protein